MFTESRRVQTRAVSVATGNVLAAFTVAPVNAPVPPAAPPAILMVLPMLAMIGAVLGLNALGDGLRRELDPVARR